MMVNKIRLILIFTLSLSLTACINQPVSPPAESSPQTAQKTDIKWAEKAPIQNQPVQTDIWHRIQLHAGLPACQDIPEADKWARWYANQDRYMKRVFKRAEPLLHFILNETLDRNLPSEFALLPVIESAYYPFAYSHGRAAGLWQFIPATAKDYGLKQNWWYDGRRDIYLSTHAAGDHLRKLGDWFDDDWLIVLAAYNGGQNRVARQVKKLKLSGQSPHFSLLKLPKETRSYIPKMAGLACLIRNPEHYGYTLPKIADQSAVKLVSTEGQIDISLAAELSGLDIETLYRFNPAFNRWATDPDGPHHLLLPINAAKAFESQLSTISESQRVTWRRVKIQSGDTLIGLAQKHHVTVELLKAVNQLDNHVIRSGRHLLVPESRQSQSAYVQSTGERLKRLQKRASSGTTHYTVQSGDSFWSISRKYGVKTRDLAKWNGMAPGDTLSVGRVLSIHNPGKKPVRIAQLHSKIQKIRYTVREGESLWSISKKFNVSVENVKVWNKLKRNLLKPGQQLSIQVDVINGSP